MSTTYHLRPVSDISPSPSPTASTTPPGDHSPHYKQPTTLRPSPAPAALPVRRRPMSPSSLRGKFNPFNFCSFLANVFFQSLT